MTPRARLTSFLSEADGNATVFCLFLLMTFLAVGSLSVDYANGESERQHMQVVADAAAMAAVHDLPNEAAARTSAITSARLNAPAQTYGEVVAASGVTVGRWDAQTRTFQAGATPLNAVSVIARRTKANGNAVSTYLMGFLGIRSLDVSARAVSVLGGPPCGGTGFFSAGRVFSTSGNQYRDGFCLHGETGVTMTSGNTFQAGTGLSMRNRSTLSQTTGNVGVNEALRETTVPLTLPARIPGLINQVLSRDFAAIGGASYINRTERVPAITAATPLTSGTLYLVTGDVTRAVGQGLENIAIIADGRIELTSGHTLRNVILASRTSIRLTSGNTLNNATLAASGSIELTSGNTLHNVTLAASGSITLTSGNNIGQPNPCAGGTYSVHMLAVGQIEFTSGITLNGTQIASQSIVKFTSGITAANGVYIEAAGNIEYTSGGTLRGCPAGLRSQISGTALPRQARFAL